MLLEEYKKKTMKTELLEVVSGLISPQSLSLRGKDYPSFIRTILLLISLVDVGSQQTPSYLECKGGTSKLIGF
jgi:hypothetical protein